MATFIMRTDIGRSGIRVAVKDLIDVAGIPTTAGSRAVGDFAEPAAADAACLTEIRRLVTAGQARLIGKANLHELAFGITGCNPWYGTPVNPVDPTLVPGGSSSGSAVAVATDEAEVALGSDTGGSVRIPAACCGVTGLKTTWGRIPLDGVWPLAPSLDTVGPLARDVAGLVSGMRLLEPGFSAAASPAERLGRLRIAAEPLTEPSIEAAIDRALRLAGFGAAADIDISAGWLAAYQAGGRVLSHEAWHSDHLLVEQTPDLVGAETAARIRASAQVTAADYAAARHYRGLWQAQLGELFGQVQLLALPTLAGYPPPMTMPRFNGNWLTLPVNLAGLPALALPVRTESGLPASLQLIGPAGREDLLLATGLRIEAAQR